MARMSSDDERSSENYGDSSQLTNWISDLGETFHMTPEVYYFVIGSLEIQINTLKLRTDITSHQNKKVKYEYKCANHHCPTLFRSVGEWYGASNDQLSSEKYGDGSQLTNWILDSGATWDMTQEVSDFILGSLEDTDKYLEVADRHHVTAKQKGQVRIQMCDNNGKTFIENLYNVL